MKPGFYANLGIFVIVNALLFVIGGAVHQRICRSHAILDLHLGAYDILAPPENGILRNKPLFYIMRFPMQFIGYSDHFDDRIP